MSDDNLKYGFQTKKKLAEQHRSAGVGCRVWAKLKSIEVQLFNAGLMPNCEEKFS